MTRRGATFAIAFLVACASDKQTDGPGGSPRGPRHRAPTQEVAAPDKVPEPQPWDPFAGTQVKPEQQLKKPVAEEERDYGAELLAAIGSPVNCLEPRTGKEAPTDIQIALQANVVESGVVTRGYARSSQLRDDELECVQARLSSLRLRGPIPGAPRTVSATLELKQGPSAAKPEPEKEAALDDPQQAEQEKTPAEPVGEDALHEGSPNEYAPREDAPPGDAPREDAPPEDAPREDAPPEDAPREDAPPEDAPRQDTLHEDTFREERLREDALR
jgi:hypothetical protein